jgi:DNA-binding winged helix-turn-helix (wHTH) protein/tetratricopeptide (TPR) repeat protein
MSAMEKPVYRFGEFELDPEERRLLAHGQPVTLTPKVFDTLVLLVEHAGHAVSKDELMHALWPRGFVDESNLTKHIWLIRKALGDAEHEGRCIETVPKRGYRFVAPVQRVARVDAIVDSAVPMPVVVADPANETVPAAIGLAPADHALFDSSAAHGAWIAGRDSERRQLAFAQEQITAGKPTPRRTRRAWIAGIVVAILAVAAVSTWRYASRETPAPATSLPGTAVAIIAFNNLSQNPKDAWLAPALGEMLSTEIAAGGQLHALPDELVRPARADLAAPLAGGYAAQSLATLRKRLGTDYVLSGSYLVTGSGEQPQLRLDLALQDARNGAAVATLARSGAVADLPALVIQSGAILRDKLGLPSASNSELREVAAAQPPNSEVARHVGFALDALQKYDPARARDELLQAIAQAPGYAPAYMYLAQAWSALGYRAKALAASKQALANAQDLPEEQRLQIEAQQSRMQADHPRTVGILRKLAALRSQNPEYSLQLVDALCAAGKPDEADSVLTALRAMPAIMDDPRAELAAVQIANVRDDKKAASAHAQRALQLAQARGEPGLIANAQLQLGIASGDTPAAESLLRQAAADYAHIGNPHGEAQSYQNLGNLLFARNQITPARETYQRAMTIYQSVGDLGGVAAIYDDLSRMLWSAGDRDGAETAARQSLQIARETNDLVRQAWNLAGLATLLSDESDSDEVASMYQQAISLDEQAGERTHHVFALATYGDLLRQRGDLEHAREVCMKALTEAKALADAEQIASADFECAQIALDRGDVDAAAASLKTIEKNTTASGDTFDAANAQLMLGQIAMGRQQWVDARAFLESSLKGWTASQEPAGQAVSESLLALCYSALGDTSARDKAAAHAVALHGQVNQRAEVLPVDIALAQLRGETGARDTAISTLRALADDADKRRWIGMAMEARLGAVQLLDRGSDSAVAKKSHDDLAASARQLGYGWVLQRLAMIAKPAVTTAR